MSGETLQALAESLPRHGDRRALGLRGAYATRWWSYRRVHEEALQYAAVLEDRGVGHGERVAIWGANSPEWTAAALGAILRGAVVVPIDGSASPEHARLVMSRAGARVVLHDGAVDASACAQPLPLLAIGAPPHAARVVAVAPDDAAFELFTSGSTREPRGVVLTHRNLATQAAAFARWRRVTRPRAWRLLALSPLSHAQGVVMGLVVPLSLGLSVLYSESVEPAHVMGVIRRNRVNLLLAVPRVQGMLAQALRERPYRGGERTVGERVATIRRFPLRRHVLFLATHRELGYSFWVLLVGGAPLPAEDERFWYECGYVLVQGYGLTETTAIVSVRVNSPFGARLGSVGRALAHHDLRIAGDGEVLVRGPSVSSTDDYLHTGDVGALDARGRLWLRGRKNDMIVTTEGENVHAEDVEMGLRAVAGVRDAVVVDGGGQVHAVLLLEHGVVAEQAVTAANTALEPYQRVRSWSVWPDPDFPRGPLLKVRRADVLGAAPREAPRTPAPSLDGVRAEGDRARRLRLLARYLTEPGGADPADADIVIEDLALSSLDAVELQALIEGLRARSLPELTVTPGTSVAELRAAISERAPARRSRLPVRQPRWSPTLPGRLLRLLTRPLLIGGWAHLAVRISADAPGAWGREPCVLAVAPHRHWLDAFIVQACLPAFTPTITVTNRDFSEHFAPGPGVPRRTRASVGLAYHLLWPLVYEFAIVPNFGSTRTGLHELGAAIDRGGTPISFPKGLAPPGEPNPRHETGVAAVAIQAGLPVVPVWLAGNDELRVRPRRPRPRVRVRFGDAIATPPGTVPAEVVERVEAAYAALAG